MMVKVRTRRTLLTAEELFRLSADCCYELVKGELYEMPRAGARHGSSAMRVGILLGAYVNANQLGEVFAAETGFILRRDPDTVRAPDAFFVANDRLPEVELPLSFLELAPDLAVEVVSPGVIQHVKCRTRWRTGSGRGRASSGQSTLQHAR